LSFCFDKQYKLTGDERESKYKREDSDKTAAAKFCPVASFLSSKQQETMQSLKTIPPLKMKSRFNV
jgi:hypothetical protein